MPDIPSGSLEVLVELHLKSGVRRYSRVGVASPSNYWEPRLISVSGINREVSVIPRDYRVSGFTVRLADSDNVLSALRISETFRRRRVVVRFGDLGVGEERFHSGGVRVSRFLVF